MVPHKRPLATVDDHSLPSDGVLASKTAICRYETSKSSSEGAFQTGSHSLIIDKWEYDGILPSCDRLHVLSPGESGTEGTCAEMM